MTLSERNAFFRVGAALCVVFTLAAAAASYLIIPAYSSIMKENLNRPSYIMQAISGRFLESNYYAVHISLVFAVLFSLAGMLTIHKYFERTSTPEILYISFFIFSLSFEIIRFIIPMNLIYTYPIFYLFSAAKALLFTRFFGLFSLLTAAICAAGLEAQKTRSIILILIIAVIMVVVGVPVNTQTWDTSFKMLNGYNNMLRGIEVAALIATFLSFLAAAKIRDSKDYVYVGLGAVAALAGRNVLIGTDNLAAPVLGIFLLSFGTWIVCSKIHKIHLWL